MADNLNPLPPAERQQAAIYCQLINAAYYMYDNDSSNLTPALPPASQGLWPANYKFIAWVLMRDFFIWQSPYCFYGLIAQNTAVANDYVLVIRGTSDAEEWWDDFRSLELTTLPNFGDGSAQVGNGFLDIYQTLLVHPPQPLPPTGVMTVPSVSFGAAGSFADQVAAAIQRHAAESTAPGAAPLSGKMSVNVVGHSLGSALATLYVAENTVKQPVQVRRLCTLASPRVGDPSFAKQFDALGIESWRIVNYPDVVPSLPPCLAGFKHIQTKYLYDSYSWTQFWPECWHSSYTYWHMLDPTQPPSQFSWWQTCYYPPTLRSAALRARRRRASGAAALAAPAAKEIAVAAPAGSTINVTIKVG